MTGNIDLFSGALKNVIVSVDDVLVPAYYTPYISTKLPLKEGEETHHILKNYPSVLILPIAS